MGNLEANEQRTFLNIRFVGPGNGMIQSMIAGLKKKILMRNAFVSLMVMF